MTIVPLPSPSPPNLAWAGSDDDDRALFAQLTRIRSVDDLDQRRVVPDRGCMLMRGAAFSLGVDR
jgi:hypothetical protein